MHDMESADPTPNNNFNSVTFLIDENVCLYLQVCDTRDEWSIIVQRSVQ